MPYVEGLLHLGAFAVALSATRVGLDKLEKFQAAYDTIAPDVAQQIARAQQILVRLDLFDQRRVAVLHPDFGMFDQYLICNIADIKYRVPYIKRFGYFFKKQVYIPFLSYFRRHWDTKIAGFMTLFSFSSFLYLVATTLDDFGMTVRNSHLCYLFFLYTAIIIWIFCTMIILHWRLQRIRGVCEACFARIEGRMDQIGQLAQTLSRSQPPSSPS